MKTLGIRQTKAHLSALVRAAAIGEGCLITDNGKLVEMIAPLPEDLSQAKLPPLPVDDARPLSDAAAFRKALLSAPYPLELDF